MAEIDTKALLESMRAQLEADESAGQLAGISVEDIEEAISHPKAAGVIAETMAAEAGSVQQGQPAPDFTLPWLPGSAGSAAATLTLSDHFGDRPVALIFGSYT
jgi:hypothetical protein